MENSDRVQFLTRLTMLAETFRRELDELTIEAYWLVVRDLSVDAFAAGVRRCMAECEFMPPPAKLRRLSADNHWARIEALNARTPDGRYVIEDRALSPRLEREAERKREAGE